MREQERDEGKTRRKRSERRAPGVGKRRVGRPARSCCHSWDAWCEFALSPRRAAALSLSLSLTLRQQPRAITPSDIQANILLLPVIPRAREIAHVCTVPPTPTESSSSSACSRAPGCFRAFARQYRLRALKC